MSVDLGLRVLCPVPIVVLRVLVKVDRGRRRPTPIPLGFHDPAECTVRGFRIALRLLEPPEMTSAILFAIYVNAGRETAPTTLRT